MSIYVGVRDGMGNSTEKDLMALVEDVLDHDGGIVASGDFIVEEQDTPAMTVDIDTGRAYVWCSSLDTFQQVVMDTSTSKSIDPNSSGSTRYDLVCIKIDVGVTPNTNASNVASIIVVKGTPGAGVPSTPANYYKLAEITVADGETEITSTEITDRRETIKISAGKFNLLTGGNIEVNDANPYRTIVLPAQALSPCTSSPCAAPETIEATTNDVDYKVIAFDKTSAEMAFVAFAMPDSWDGGTIKFRTIWTSAGGSADQTFILGLKGRAYANSDAIDQAYGDEVKVSDALITVGDVHISATSEVVTLAGSPAGGQLIQLKLTRDIADTLDNDARLIAVIIEYQVNRFSD